jgi:hypothetical protein
MHRAPARANDVRRPHTQQERAVTVGNGTTTRPLRRWNRPQENRMQYVPGKPFQIVWARCSPPMLLQVPVAGSQVLVGKQQIAPANGRNVWIQKHPQGRIYLVDANGQATPYCLEAALPDSQQAADGFACADGCLVFLGEDRPHRQTQLWTITPLADSDECRLTNLGISLSLQDGPHGGDYVLDSGAVGAPGSAAKLWHAQDGNPNQRWRLQDPVGQAAPPA